ncbi:MAG: hypothetical protein E6J60_15820, partial [Deltaproteobacteria bacterium]
RTFKPETGLGPLFNSTGCGECHENPKAGGRGDEVEVHATAFRAKVCDPLVQEGGFVIQQHTTPALKQALGIDQEPFPPSATARATRTTAEIFARGLLDLVPEADILAYADPDDRNHDGISGRPNHSVDGRLGRFGRKAFVPTLAEFNAGAFVAEMGITNPAEPTEENIGGKPIPPGVDPVPDPEITQAALDLTDDFVRFLARPSPAKLCKKGRRGRDLFAQIGCAACHVPTLRTGPSPIHALDRKEFPAYTDLLLHDMGPELADICLGRATPSEFRTEPLIDLRDAKSFLHDGRASTLEQAIAAHGGEGSGARDRFGALAPADRQALIAFLDSL